MTAFIKRFSRGEVSVPLAVLISVVGLAVTGFAGVVFNTTNNLASTITKVDDKVNAHDAEIAGIKARIERIPYIEEKLDVLLENRGINPEKILPASVIQSTKP